MKAFIKFLGAPLRQKPSPKRLNTNRSRFYKNNKHQQDIFCSLISIVSMLNFQHGCSKWILNSICTLGGAETLNKQRKRPDLISVYITFAFSIAIISTNPYIYMTTGGS